MATTRRTTKTDETASTNGGAPAGRKSKTPATDAKDNHGAPEPPQETKARKKPKTAGPPLTMTRLRDLYLDELERAGKSLGTRFSYGVDLAVACGFLGPDTNVADLTPDDVRRFFDSDVVTKTRTGKAKSPLTVDKTRRVLRLALIWAAEDGLIATAPIPMDALPPRRRKNTVDQLPTVSDEPA